MLRCGNRVWGIVSGLHAQRVAAVTSMPTDATASAERQVFPQGGLAPYRYLGFNLNNIG